ncbi:DUF86 domain-containing protein [Nitrosomonas sp. Nm33]|uniref:type VII toxin-antitoxin system HepT family RNase toxin n=1 Tax=Nitrosomonas sp. Nm33 TaxID=133724 RepID=UPI00089868E2|nr:DUF86 domain-containing protein [Nitrosomonas sp. Nm33]SDY62324.1 Uncharacterized conserved protein YutE, UPF0331/DUF86 family [Nitrosomonas sp. Nm33]
MNDIILGKKVSIERCIKQINQYYRMETGLPFVKDQLRLDAVAMNLQRAAELTIDIANHLVKICKLGLPRDSRESFTLLAQAGVIDEEMVRKLQGMVGFRNILVHEYQELDMQILIDVIEHRTQDLLEFANRALRWAN